MKNISYFLLGIIGIFISCTKQQGKDIDLPEITVVEPSMMDTIFLSVVPEVHIEFTTVDNDALETISVQLLDGSNKAIKSFNLNIGSMKVYPFHEHILLTGITYVTSMKVNIIVTDQSGNKQSKVVDFFVAP